MLPFSIRFFPFKRDEQRTPWNYIFGPDFRIRNPSARFFLCQPMGNCFLWFFFLAILDFIAGLGFHFGIPQTSIRVCEIVLTGTSGRCLIDSPSMVTLQLAKPARRATACSLGLNEPVAMGVGAPCTHALSTILGIGVHDKKLDLATLPRTGKQETE